MQASKYIDMNAPITIHCRKHHLDFKVTPAIHLAEVSGGCPGCRKELDETPNQRRLRLVSH